MKTIYRYEINSFDGINKIEMPLNAKIINCGIASVGGGKDIISIWAEVDTDSHYFDTTRNFYVFGTGADMTELFEYNPVYIGTVCKSNMYAFHIYEVNV